MLIRQRLETIRKLVTEYNLSVDAVLVTSNCNLADRLTRVPQRWYDAMKKEAGPVPLLCAASVEAADKIREIHQTVGTLERDILFCAIDQSDSVKKCSESGGQGMPNMPVNRPRPS